MPTSPESNTRYKKTQAKHRAFLYTRIMKRIFIALLLVALTATTAHTMELKVSVSHFRPTLTGKYMAGNLLDNDTKTVWASSELNNGVGSWFSITFPKVVALKNMTIYSGHQGGEFDDFARIHTGRLVFTDGSEQHFELEDITGPQVVECWTVPTREVTVEVDSIYPENTDRHLSLAVSELKFRILGGVDAPKGMPEKGVLGELAQVIRNFYTYQTTMDDDFLQYIPKEKFEEERFGFEVFKQMQKQQGTFDIMRRSVIDTDALHFRLMRFKDNEAVVHSFGHYLVIWKEHITPIPDDSVFTIRKEKDGWKVAEIRDYAKAK